jgi:hypothetical protein
LVQEPRKVVRQIWILAQVARVWPAHHEWIVDINSELARPSRGAKFALITYPSLLKRASEVRVNGDIHGSKLGNCALMLSLLRLPRHASFDCQ